MKPTISFLTYDWSMGTKPLEPNGCAWYRCYLPMKELEKHGWDAGLGFPGWNDDHGFGLLVPDDRAIHGWDIIVFKLIMLKTVAEKMNKAKEMGQKIVVDIDDWFEGLSKSNLAHKMTDPSKNENNNREHYMSIIDNADAIITSTPFLYDFYKNEKGKKNVYMVRNGIDVNRWQPRRDHSRWLPQFGWVGATPWRSNDLEEINPLFGQFLEKNRLSFHHAGHIKNANYAKDQLGIPNSVKTTEEPMQPISRYPQMFRKIDVGIVPLSDVGFNHAKSGIKGLEYSAAGVPWIASYSPEYAILEEQGIGRVAKNEREWMGHLEELLDPRVRKEDAERNLENVKKYQSMEIRGADWNEVMQEIKNI
jgi:glycosyltransferase involved in cell wall biosynthesis